MRHRDDGAGTRATRSRRTCRRIAPTRSLGGVTAWLHSLATIDPARVRRARVHSPVPSARLGRALPRPSPPARDRRPAARRAALGRAGGAGPRGARHRARHGVRHGPARDHAHVPRGDRAGGGERRRARRPRRRHRHRRPGGGAGAARRAARRRARRRRGGAAAGAREPGTESAPAGCTLLGGGVGGDPGDASTSSSPTCWPTRWIEQAVDLAARVAAPGRLVVSGVLDTQADAVAAAFPALRLTAHAGRRPLAHAPPRALMLRLYVPGVRRGRPAGPHRGRRAAPPPHAAARPGSAPARPRRRRRRARRRRSSELGARRGDRARRRQRQPAPRVAARAGARARAAEGRQDGPGGREGDRARRAPPRARDRRPASSGEGAHLERWRRIAVAAAKQSGRTRVPTVDAPVPLDALARAPWPGLRLVPWEEEASRAARRPAGARRGGRRGRRPRGRLRRRRGRPARAHGFVPITLGPRVLRAETAALVVAALCQHRWGDG